MPKIELQQDELFKYSGREFSADELEEALTIAKAEIDDPVDEHGLIKIELNDTNRPDLWSTAGLGRALRLYHGSGSAGRYEFFSRPDSPVAAGERRIVVDSELSERRPYITAFAISGPPIADVLLDDLIQTQEKLCWNYGRKRKAIAMGVYREDKIQYPVRYKAVDPDSTTFVPLGLDTELSLRQIIEQHPKGREFGGIVSALDKFPFLSDNSGAVLSFPPVINSADVGAVQAGDTSLFIEMTGTDLKPLLLACSIVACDLADAGYTVHPVQVEYPYDTPFGRTVVSPLYFQQPVSVELAYAERLLGAELNEAEAVQRLGKMGVRAEAASGVITAYPPEYRNDFLHPVDVVEDLMIGYGMNAFPSEAPRDFTVGRLTESEIFSREVKTLLVGMGYQEMIFNYLGSRRDFIDNMYPEELRAPAAADCVRIANPMSENFEFVRPSIIPQLLGAESVSAHAVYPHYIFEVGKVAVRDADDNYGSRTVSALGAVVADADAGFNLVSSQAAALFFYLGLKYEPSVVNDPRFLAGRVAALLVKGERVGVLGELHPQVLENWGVTVPCAVIELDLDLLRRVSSSD